MATITQNWSNFAYVLVVFVLLSSVTHQNWTLKLHCIDVVKKKRTYDICNADKEIQKYFDIHQTLRSLYKYKNGRLFSSVWSLPCYLRIIKNKLSMCVCVMHIRRHSLLQRHYHICCMSMITLRFFGVVCSRCRIS